MAERSLSQSKPERRRGPASAQGLGLALDRAPDAPPLYRQIRDGVRSAVLSGVLGAGSRLPPERELAAALDVNRTTVMRAYKELVSDGVVEARPGRGTIVAATQPLAPGSDLWSAKTPGSPWLLGLPAFGRGNVGSDGGILREMAALAGREDVVSFAIGAPASDLVPHAQLYAALQRTLEHTGPAGLNYGPVEGLAALRGALAAHLQGRGMAVAPDELLVLSGATQGLDLVARALVEPGDEVVVEAPTYIGALQSFGLAGARLIGVPVDDDGLRLDLLAPILTRRRVRLIVVQPTLHNPTGASLTAARRERLVALARRHGVPILEDDIYGELWNDGPPPQPLKSLDRDGLVLHLGSLSKTLAPGLRVGWLAAPAPIITRLALVKQFADMNTNALGQLAALGFLQSGDYVRHLQLVRDEYAQRRVAMLDGLRAASLWLDVPEKAYGGFYLWCRLRYGRARLLASAAARAGVALIAGDVFYAPGTAAGVDGDRYLRLSFAGTAPPVIEEGLRRLVPLLVQMPEMSDAAAGRGPGLRPVV